ncbi:MAG: hypothetical protein LBV63_02810 [Candidatus Methanoplasma sp.]|jgi:hypothetical protein|nr:hypothetical protein [Candidatus Methanoplasma sp.]
MSSEENSWFEGLAKEILEKYCADRYYKLEKIESPDFQDTVNKIGVEVTRAGYEEDFKVSSIFGKVVGRVEEELTEKEKRKLKRNRISVIDMDDTRYQSYVDDLTVEDQNLTFLSCKKHGICIGDVSVRMVNNDTVIDAIKYKIESINAPNYGVYDKYDLFVHAELFKFYEEWIEIPDNLDVKRRCIAFEIIDIIQALQEGRERIFSVIYVLHYNVLYELNLEKREYRHRTVKHRDMKLSNGST